QVLAHVQGEGDLVAEPPVVAHRLAEQHSGEVAPVVGAEGEVPVHFGDLGEAVADERAAGLPSRAHRRSGQLVAPGCFDGQVERVAVDVHPASQHDLAGVQPGSARIRGGATADYSEGLVVVGGAAGWPGFAPVGDTPTGSVTHITLLQTAVV